MRMMRLKSALLVVGIVTVGLSYLAVGRGLVHGSPLEVILGGIGLVIVSIAAKTLK